VPAQDKWAQEPPDVEWLVPELDDGVDDPLLRPALEELELDEPEVDPEEPEPEEPVEPEPVLVEPEPVLVEPELLVPDDEPVDPDEVEVCEDDVPLVCEPGSIRVTTPAVTTLAMPTVAVVV
jgi:hypothetical protein